MMSFYFDLTLKLHLIQNVLFLNQVSTIRQEGAAGVGCKCMHGLIYEAYCKSIFNVSGSVLSICEFVCQKGVAQDRIIE